MEHQELHEQEDDFYAGDVPEDAFMESDFDPANAEAGFKAKVCKHAAAPLKISPISAALDPPNLTLLRHAYRSTSPYQSPAFSLSSSPVQLHTTLTRVLDGVMLIQRTTASISFSLGSLFHHSPAPIEASTTHAHLQSSLFTCSTDQGHLISR